jgi:hypothetical protein
MSLDREAVLWINRQYFQEEGKFILIPPRYRLSEHSHSMVTEKRIKRLNRTVFKQNMRRQRLMSP